ncbi:PulJ/GspJ family protein [Pelagicoccus mobilis]|uniref:Prepilin-type N-terminal cleavage/methylation domain-containing protein n=1 Tax=Pelagicoccus mobilis TaxID=415221 RepID=A0A934VNS4_9BACT|nr:prepilin-type N-terminal cleavage/methylation domain-containing protein [Pelagicoccus mobilis]MBK1876532.1 prepilin-type N-terminal cleavage/methylation domain-containing protein [Pelagicoccus mobilis]
MMRNRNSRSAGFSLLEVVIALAMLALIAVPAVGLATMAVSSSKEQMKTGAASELKARVDVALRGYGSGAVFSTDLIPAEGDLAFVASENLQFIELEGSVLDNDNDAYYRIVIDEPKGYSFTGTDTYRLVVYRVEWPNNTSDPASNQLFFTTVFRK